MSEKGKALMTQIEAIQSGQDELMRINDPELLAEFSELEGLVWDTMTKLPHDPTTSDPPKYSF